MSEQRFLAAMHTDDARRFARSLGREPHPVHLRELQRHRDKARRARTAEHKAAHRFARLLFVQERVSSERRRYALEVNFGEGFRRFDESAEVEILTNVAVGHSGLMRKYAAWRMEEAAKPTSQQWPEPSRRPGRRSWPFADIEERLSSDSRNPERIALPRAYRIVDLGTGVTVDVPLPPMH